MTYKQIEASREVRLWIGQILVPATMLGATIMLNPNVQQTVTTKVQDIKQTVRNKIKRSGR